MAVEESSLAIFCTDLGHLFVSDVRNDLGMLMRGKGPLEPAFAYDIVRIHSIMIYTDLVEYIIVEDKKAPGDIITTGHESGDIIATGQYMDYQTFSSLQFRRLLKNSFHSINIDLRDTSGAKIHIVSVEITQLFLMLRKVSDIQL